MDYGRRLVNYYRRLNVQLDEQQELQRCKNRLITAIDRSVGLYVLETPSISVDFAIVIGKKLPTTCYPKGWTAAAQQMGRFILGDYEKFDRTPVFEEFAAVENERQLRFALQVLFWVLEEHQCPHIDSLANTVGKTLDMCPVMQVRIARAGKQVTLYPKGARLLDDKNVNDVLEWLSGYPVVSKHFENALELFLRNDSSQYRNLLDELRTAMERLVRKILGNRKNLENQKDLLLGWMKQRKTHVQVRNLYNTLLVFFGQYQNEAVKHGNGWQEVEIEYMIYLTGTFMRFLLQLDSEAKAST
jgi:hypothetical protein